METVSTGTASTAIQTKDAPLGRFFVWGFGMG